MNENLEFSFVAIVEEICIREKCLIRTYKPILNSNHNPQKSAELKRLRKRCREYALTSCEAKKSNIKNQL